jgi:hypothetical protein
MAQHPKIPILGMVENLSDEGLFGAGDVEKSAVELAVPYRDEVPLERRIIRLADEGLSILVEKPGSEAAKAISVLADWIIAEPEK